jgi:hypothetical protein
MGLPVRFLARFDEFYSLSVPVSMIDMGHRQAQTSKSSKEGRDSEAETPEPLHDPSCALALRVEVTLTRAISQISRLDRRPATRPP